MTTVPDSLWAFFAGQIRFMVDRGMVVEAVSSPGRFLGLFAEREQVPVHALPMARRISPLADLVSLLRMCRLLARLKPDIVHAHTPKGGLLGMLGAWLVGTPVRIYHIHGFPFLTATGRKRTVLVSAEKLSCRLATRVLCVSRSIAAVADQEGVCPADRILVPGSGTINGIDATGIFDPARYDAGERASLRASHGIPPEATVVGFVGRLVRDKGVAELAQAWMDLSAVFPDLHLLVCGPVEDGDPVSADVLEYLRTAGRVHLTGEVLDMPACYAAMDILALPTYREGFPLVPMEASAMALPVVASAVPGCTDAVVDGVTGTLVPARDASALAGALMNYVENPGLRLRHGQAGRDRVLADFRPEAVWAAVHAEYLRLLQA